MQQDQCVGSKGIEMRAIWKYLLPCFGLTWIVWIPGTLLHTNVIILTFGSAGPALAAMWLARDGCKPGVQSKRRLAYGTIVWVICCLILQISPPGSATWQWPFVSFW
jgi:hypothetical protein